MDKNPYYLAPSELTSGKGFDFEDLVSTWLATYMLCSLPFFPNKNATIEKISFQVGNSGWLLDDILLTLKENGQHVNCAISIKSNKQFTAKKAPADFVEAIWQHYLQQDDKLFDRDKDYLGIITTPLSAAADIALRSLLDKAQHSIDAELSEKIAKGYFSKNVTCLYESFTCPEDLAKKHQVEKIDLDNLLKRLKIFSSDLNCQTSSNFTLSILNCKNSLVEPKMKNATDLFDQLHLIVKPTRVNGGSLNNAVLVDKLCSQFKFEGHPDYTHDIKLLANYTQTALDKLPHRIGGSLVIERTILTDEIITKLDKDKIVFVLGESGAGKSVLARSISITNFANKTIWLDSHILQSQNPFAERAKLKIEHEWTDLIAHLPFDDYIVVFDGVDQLNNSEHFATAAQLLKPFLNNDANCKILITCQQAHWSRVQQAFLQHANQIDTSKFHTIGNFSQTEVKQITASFPQFTKVFDSSKLQSLLVRPKIIDLFCRNALLPDTSAWTSEADLIEWYWLIEIAQKNKGIMREAFSLELATKLGDTMQSSLKYSTFPVADLAILEDLEPDGICQRFNGRIGFAHDLFADWFRQRVLLSNVEDDQQYLFTKINLPTWHKAITLFGLHLLEKQDDKALWLNLVKASLADENLLLAADLMLESIILSSRPGLLIETLWSDLINNKAELLKRLLTRFLFVATEPNSLNMLLAPEFGIDAATAATLSRKPIYSYWPGFLSAIERNQSQFIQLAPLETASICEAWLKHTASDTNYRVLMSKIAIELAWKVLQHNQNASYSTNNEWLSYKDVKTSYFYKIAFMAIHDELDDITKISSCASGLSQPTNKLMLEPPSVPLTDAKRFKLIEQLRALNTHEEDVVEMMPITDGPIFPIQRNFQCFFLQTPNASDFITLNPKEAAKIILALCIREAGAQHSDSHWELDNNYDLTNNLYDFLQPFKQNPFSHLLSVSPKDGLNVILRITEVATNKWLKEEKKRTKNSMHTSLLNENNPLTLTIELNGQSKTWIGERQWMYACRATTMAPKILVSALMALEMWLANKLDDDKDISADILHILKVSNSMAIIGVCLQLAKKQPCLFKGVCSGFLNIPEIFIYDLYHVVSGEKHQMMAFYGARYTNREKVAAKDWHQQKYRQIKIENIVLNLLLVDSQFNDFVISEVLPSFKNWLENTEQQEHYCELILRLVQEFDRSNWQYTEASENKLFFGYTGPDIEQSKKGNNHNQRDITLDSIQIPMRCREAIDKGTIPTSVDMTIQLETYATLEFEHANIEQPHELMRIRCALAALLYKYKSQLNDVWQKYGQWCCKVMIDASTTAPEMDLPFEMDCFCADIIPLMWVDNRNDKEIRTAIADLCIGQHYGTVGRLFSTLSNYRNELADDFYRLYNLATHWSVYRHRITIELNKTNSADQLYEEFKVFYDQFVDGSLTTIIPNLINLEHSFYENIYISKKYGQDILYRRPTGVDFTFLENAYDWLPALDKAINNTERLFWLHFWLQCSQAIVWQLDNGVVKIDKIDDMPYAFDNWLLGRLPGIILSCKTAEEAASLWKPILALGFPAHYWITEFFSGWFSELNNEATRIHFFSQCWNEMIEFALASENWKKKNNSGHYLQEIWDAIFGLEPLTIEYVWKNQHIGIVNLMTENFEKYASTYLSTGSIDKLARFLSTNSANDIRYQGIIWIDTCISNDKLRSDDSDTERYIVNLIKLILDDIGKFNSLASDTKSSLLSLLKMMASRQNTIAMTIYEDYLN